MDHYLRFNNPNNEAFTVTFNVIGNLARGGSSSLSASAKSGSSDNATSGGSGGSGSASASATGVVTSLLQLTYDPLLNTVTVQLLKL